MDKLLTTIAAVMLFIDAYTVSVTPLAKGAELSIYDAFPVYFWILLTVSTCCGVGILIHQAFLKQQSGWWGAGFLIVIFSNSLFLALPFFRGYGFFPRFDAMTHVGMMKDIIAAGHIGLNNFYPVVHLLGVSVSYLTGLTENAVVNLLFVYWNFIFILGVYILSTLISRRRGQALLITAFACPLFFSYMGALIHPSMFSIFLTPFLLFVYQKAEKSYLQRRSFSILLVLLAFIFTCTHPVTSIFFIAISATLVVSTTLYRYIQKSRSEIILDDLPAQTSFNVPFLLCLLFWIWYVSYPPILQTVVTVYDILANATHETLLVQNIDVVRGSGIPLGQAVTVFVFRFGVIFLYAFMGTIVAGIVLGRLLLRQKPHFERFNFMYALAFVVAAGASLFSLAGFTGEFDVVRVSRFFLVLSPFIIGLTFFKLVATEVKPDIMKTAEHFKRAIYIIFICIFLAISIYLSFMNVYGSIRTKKSNFQVTRMELEGSKWFSNYQDKSITIIDTPGDFERFEDFNFGIATSPFERAKRDPSPMPTQFGYDDNTFLVEILNYRTRYLLTSEASRLTAMLISNKEESQGYDYGGQGFSQLMQDQSVSLIYVNGEFEAWEVLGN